jgi:hypothetical protein
MLPAPRTVARPQIECRHSFREPLHFIVITVISVISSIFSDTYGILCMTVDRLVFGGCHVFVMFTVIVET